MHKASQHLTRISACMLQVDHPLDDDSTIWDMAQSRGNSLVAPHNKDSMVENLYWPYERAKLSSVGEVWTMDRFSRHGSSEHHRHMTGDTAMCIPQVCIEGGGADCCCKAVATWKVYARYETSKDAAAFLDSIEGLNSSDLRFCMGLATSGFRPLAVA